MGISQSPARSCFEKLVSVTSPITGAELHPLLSEVFQSLTRQQVRWCLLREDGGLASPGSDVDVLLDPADLRHARSILSELGFVHLPAWGRGPHLFWLTYDRDNDMWIKLDVVTGLTFGPLHEFESSAAGACLSRRRRHGPVATLEADDAFWTLLLHCLLDKGTFPPAHRARLQDLAQTARAHGAMGRLVERMAPDGWGANRILALVEGGDWDSLDRLSPLLASSWKDRQRMGAWRLRRLLNRVLRRLTRLLLLRRRGMSVALIAPDGAGKSTLAEGLKRSSYFPSVYVYMGLGPASGTRSRYRLSAFGLARLFRQWRRYLTGRYHQLRGRLVIFDRYIYDALLPPARQMSPLRRMRRWLLGRLVPSPDLVLLLDAPAEILHRRKREYGVAVLAERRQQYLRLEGRVANLAVLDASRDQEEVLREATSLIWLAYARRLTGRRDGRSGTPRAQFPPQ